MTCSRSQYVLIFRLLRGSDVRRMLELSSSCLMRGLHPSLPFCLSTNQKVILFEAFDREILCKQFIHHLTSSRCEQQQVVSECKAASPAKPTMVDSSISNLICDWGVLATHFMMLEIFGTCGRVL
ncbi:hypothetical protein KC19_9G026900 [Ceratodon purpureus]|uniref:Uncharacterized protein n=1 Tax=Ceratodon purpureus TaxID=3225 RepID=A0A8T0GQU7_CERPU|nr:hypothetical protein KC19_9G026900 [Ceratodon purpureus]